MRSFDYLLIALNLLVIITVIGLITSTQPKLKVLTVDVDSLVKKAVQNLAKNGGSEEELKAITKTKLDELNQIFLEISQTENAVIINKKAVVGGGEDITEFIKQYLAEDNHDPKK